jgi:hypothetical protein
VKKYAIAAVTAASLIVPAAASAGFMQEYDAADQVERVAGHRYHIDPLVSCRTIGRNVFTCDITDFKGDCSYSGRANVRKVSRYTYKVTTMRVSKDCF